MPTDCISYQNSGYFSSLIKDYLDEKPSLKPFYHRFAKLENFEAQIHEKATNFDHTSRGELALVLQKQYKGVPVSDLTQQNMEALKVSNTFTITTGHQLNLFSGPLYFLYKIITTINLTKDLKAKYPAYNFVPVYWMATEDHDFEEINYFNFKGKKFRWNKESSGPVGRLSTEGLDAVLELFEQELGNSTHASVLKKTFQEAYLQHTNLADATRYLANTLFGNSGLVIIDADNPVLKKRFIPYIKEELYHQSAYKTVLETTQKLSQYPIQVTPRDINLFYIEKDLRERIIYEKGLYKINNTKIHFSRTEITQLLESNPEKFSPNVIMRPLYQEVILPNLAYIGGGGEIAYWLELKSFFDAANISFPILVVRNSVLLTSEKQTHKIDKLALNWHQLFAKQETLIHQVTVQNTAFPIDLTLQKQQLQLQFKTLYELAERTDKSFVGAVKAQEIKQIKGLENLEKRLLKAQKRKCKEIITRATNLQNELFPNKSLQERQVNFSEFYLQSGTDLIPKLLAQLRPLDQKFEIISL
ncbi:bacillithiol biosynthesis cysteine-adding enzyme BshC [Flavobacterium crassostreae]|uniref:Putative cysteine ligase BshC n=1 Tax=Flavobacterium crassostreae TaxID=1763534 RepID=A0A1B9E0K7_9FLAO|nr:bacillithiol biosynthesis cysteine-adding enzyme BshC [Flavobacterium crassostreae]OCB75461.1 bacillithiol biosynthesis cysteine-adding enzyme BshC [Flavobacterium crassostreae]